MVCRALLMPLSVFLLFAAARSVQFGPDLNHIQAARITLVDNAFGLSGGAPQQAIFTFYNQFAQPPQVFQAVCSFDILNSYEVSYATQVAAKTTTTASIGFSIGAATTIYKLVVSVVAFDYYGVSVVEQSYFPAVCNIKSLTASCREEFPVPVVSTQFIIVPALIAVHLTNAYATAHALLPKSYGVEIGENYYLNISDGLSYFPVLVSHTTTLANFSVSWLLTPNSVASSDNISIVQSAGSLTSSQTYSVFNLYSPGYDMNNQSVALGLLGFSFDYQSHLQFNSYFRDVNVVQATITTTVAPTSTPRVLISSVVLGYPHCPNQWMGMLPMASCFQCDISVCATCLGSLCGSCQPGRYLRVLDSSSGAGICLCSRGSVSVNGVCASCNSSCAECTNSDPNNCTFCAYGFVLVGTACVKVCYLLQPASAQCVVCPEGCSICTDSLNCTRAVCASSYYFNDSCVPTCPTGTYAATPNGVSSCQPCAGGCLDCSSESACNSCAAQYYLDLIENSCKGCHPSCKTCTSSSNTGCSSCAIGAPDASGICSTPPDAVNCPQGLYFDGSTPICLACSSGCLLCNSTSCQVCNSSFLLRGPSCVACLAVQGFRLAGAVCVEVCGDGIRVDAECDDRNTVNGDGCSDSCAIEEGCLCEANPTAGMGDICYSRDAVLAVAVYRSFSNNSLRITLSSEKMSFVNVRSAEIDCGASLIVSWQSVNSVGLSYICSFEVDAEGQTCQVSLTPRVKKHFSVHSAPLAFALDPSISSATAQISIAFKTLLALTLAVALASHFIVPSRTTAFIGYTCAFVVSLFQTKSVPAELYGIVPSLLSLTLSTQSDFLNDAFSHNYILGYANSSFANRLWPIFALVGSYILLCALVAMLRPKLGSNAQHVFKRTLRAKNFIRSTLIMYEPLILTAALFAIYRKLDVPDVALLSLYASMLVTSLVLTWRVCVSSDTQKGRSFLLTSDGPVFHVNMLLYTFLTIVMQPDQSCFAPIVGLVLDLSSMVLLVRNSVARFQERIRLQDIRAKNRRYTHNSKSASRTLWVAANLSISQQLFNQLFFIVHNALIWVMYLLQGRNHAHYAAAMLANFALFLIANFLLVAASVYYRLKKLCTCMSAQIHPLPSTNPHLSVAIEKLSQNDNSHPSTEYSENLRYKSTKDISSYSSLNNLVFSVSSVTTSPGLPLRKPQPSERLSVIADSEQPADPKGRHDEPPIDQSRLEGNILDNEAADSEQSHMEIIPLQEDDDLRYEPSERLREI